MQLFSLNCFFIDEVFARKGLFQHLLYYIITVIVYYCSFSVYDVKQPFIPAVDVYNTLDCFLVKLFCNKKPSESVM